ncbi:MAG: cobyric acid synthase [Chloroflexi bacterium]|nr:cobyric acid synthase [Chloroflexota bacterium]MDA1228071.1 cobyric acid synthase [Chloroflexota bacterium]
MTPVILVILLGNEQDGKGKVIMVQGTTSHAGKSMFATALCRIFAQEGLRVAPFKSQNMSLNSFVTPDGGEFGRAQAVQADAARVAPTVEMNPILLKPEAERRSQVVVMGKPLRVASAREYYEMKLELWPVVTAALDTLRANYDIVVIEGAGSPAEINLKEHEIVNMRVARYANAPVVLVGDIDRGGVFASLAGTMLLLEPEEQALVKAIVINKFRGDPSLLDSGLEMLLERTGVPTIGVVPYYTDIHVPEEDSLGLDEDVLSSIPPVLEVAVIRLPRIANFDDFDPLRQEPGVQVRYVGSRAELGRPDLIVIPGSKTTVEDLLWLRDVGLAQAVKQSRAEGVPVIGICGGYQMLGQRVLDPDGVESGKAEVEGLGLLPVDTVFEGDKATHQVKGTVNARLGLLEGYDGGDVVGYEIHMGRSAGEAVNSLFRISERSGKAIDASDGAADVEGLTLGTYMHGLFHNHSLRRTMLLNLARRKGLTLSEGAALDLDGEYDKLADHIRRHVDMDVIYGLVGLR